MLTDLEPTGLDPHHSTADSPAGRTEASLTFAPPNSSTAVANSEKCNGEGNCSVRVRVWIPQPTAAATRTEVRSRKATHAKESLGGSQTDNRGLHKARPF